MKSTIYLSKIVFSPFPIVIFFNAMMFSQTTWYVLQGGAGLANGTSWANATGEVQEAIDSAASGDQIWVAGGTYYPTVEFDSDGSGGSDVREVTFYINKNIALYGGFSGNEGSLSDRDWNLNITILDGNFNEDNDSTNNAYHVLYIDGRVSSYGTDGGGNLDLDPLFQEVSSGNLQLLPYSPAINSGVNTSLSINDSLDLDGNPRVVDEIVDMGAYENQEGDCPENPVLDERYSPLDGYYPAGTSITLIGSVEISENGNVVLDAPTVSMEPTFLVTSPGLLEINQDGCEHGTNAQK